MTITRQNKVARLIQKELGDIFLKESKDHYGGKMISVTVVRITPDLSIAKVYLSIYPLQHDKDLDPLAEVHENQSRLRHELGNRVRHQLRIIPELVFYIDDSFDYLENIERLLLK
jgi:ribosome-binding factor A